MFVAVQHMIISSLKQAEGKLGHRHEGQRDRMIDTCLLQVEHLQVNIDDVAAVVDVSLSLATGEMRGLVGESGCGKSLTALSITRLLNDPPVRIVNGSIRFADHPNMLTLNEAALAKIRGRDIAMIFQEPMTSLNPVFRVGEQITEAVLLHNAISRQRAQQHAVELLGQVGIAAAASMLQRYPHELSGGQRQRIMIAMALACDPDLLIADEPTTALDVTVQAQILDLLARLRKERGMAVLLIAHDLGVVRQYCDTLSVMYAGRIVEQGAASEVFSHPEHPYTKALLNTIPALNKPGVPLPTIPGTVPAPGQQGQGCAFAPRCNNTIDRCSTEVPELGSTMHAVRCWNPVNQ